MIVNFFGSCVSGFALKMSRVIADFRQYPRLLRIHPLQNIYFRTERSDCVARLKYWKSSGPELEKQPKRSRLVLEETTNRSQDCSSECPQSEIVREFYGLRSVNTLALVWGSLQVLPRFRFRKNIKLIFPPVLNVFIFSS